MLQPLYESACGSLTSYLPLSIRLALTEVGCTFSKTALMFCAAANSKSRLHRKGEQNNMLHRGTSTLLMVILCIVALPSGNVVAKARGSQQQREQMEIMPEEDGNPYTDGFSGGYWAGGQYVSTDVYSVESDTYYAPTPDGTWEEQVDFYYSDSAMTKSDGTSLTYAVYELNRPTNYSLLHITLGGVTLTYNLYTEEAYPLPEEEQRRLEVWASSGEVVIAQNTSIALLDQSQAVDPKVMVGFVATAMQLDPAEHVSPDDPIVKANPTRKRSVRDAVMRFAKLETPRSGNSLTPCLATQGGDCFGCCGYGCRCINDRYGRPIYSSACARHDRCVRTVGLINRYCNVLFVPAVLVVIVRTAQPILPRPILYGH